MVYGSFAINDVGRTSEIQQALASLRSLPQSEIDNTPKDARTEIAKGMAAQGYPLDIIQRFDPAIAKAAKKEAISKAGPSTGGPPSSNLQSNASGSLSYAKVESKLVMTLPNGEKIKGKDLNTKLDFLWSEDKASAKKFMRENSIERRGNGDYVYDQEAVTVKGGGTLAKAAAAIAVGAGAAAVTGSFGVGSLAGAGALTKLQGGLGKTFAAIGGATDGLEFKMRDRMKSLAADQKDNQLISMINNPGIPIEDLIFLFLANVCEKYEDKLRSKMEEAAIQEKIERRQERRRADGEAAKAAGGMLGGLVSLIPGGGTVAGAMIKQGADVVIDKGVNAANDMDAAVNGSGKSATLLNNEIQVLMNKWKQMSEMLSNLIKSLHDMAMTPIRNLRG